MTRAGQCAPLLGREGPSQVQPPAILFSLARALAVCELLHTGQRDLLSQKTRSLAPNFLRELARELISQSLAKFPLSRAGQSM